MVGRPCHSAEGEDIQQMVGTVVGGEEALDAANELKLKRVQ